MRVADTSALFAALVIEDAHHGKARAELDDQEPILIPAEILSETAALLHRRIGAQNARKAIASLRELPHVEVQPTWDDAFDNILAKAQEIFAGSSRLNYPDAIVVAWCRMRGFKPLAFDRDLLRAVAA